MVTVNTRSPPARVSGPDRVKVFSPPLTFGNVVSAAMMMGLPMVVSLPMVLRVPAPLKVIVPVPNGPLVGLPAGPSVLVRQNTKPDGTPLISVPPLYVLWELMSMLELATAGLRVKEPVPAIRPL